eukprot:3976279-Heterocapsa_arctica.AAC.1
MALRVGQHKLPVEPAQQKVRHQHKKEGREGTALADAGCERETVERFAPEFDLAKVIDIQPLDYQADMRGKTRS